MDINIKEEELFQKIMIDVSFVKNIAEFSKSIGAEVIAEYVHNQEVQQIVEELNIEYSQGYCFSEPKLELVNEV